MTIITIDTDDLTFEYDGTELLDTGPALGALLATEKVFFTQEGLYVNCSDIFIWGCSDAELLTDIEDQLLPIIKLFQKDQEWGPEMWCMIQRKERPQKPVEDMIRKTGKWDFDAFIKEHNLRDNHYDGISHIKHQYHTELVNKWLAEQGKKLNNTSDDWYYSTWKPFLDANPDYYNEEYKTELKRRINQWESEHGYL